MIVDPGIGAASQIDDIVRSNDLSVAAVLLTHGHFDHTGSAAEVADSYRAGCWLAPADRGQLADPLSGLPAAMHSVVLSELGGKAPDAARRSGGTRMPARMLELDPGPHRIAGLDLTILPAPGHTPGSTLFALDCRPLGSPNADQQKDVHQVEQVVFTGDVVFAGSIGRTDLPGGDHQRMQQTLRDVVLGLADDVVLLPGHGPQTTVGGERRTNPFLRSLTP